MKPRSALDVVFSAFMDHAGWSNPETAQAPPCKLGPCRSYAREARIRALSIALAKQVEYEPYIQQDGFGTPIRPRGRRRRHLPSY